MPPQPQKSASDPPYPSPDHIRQSSRAQANTQEHSKGLYKKGSTASQQSQGAVAIDQESASPSHRSNQNQIGQPRISQDFKMRILTKKKVTVPPSATS